jgi:hypothetical protein
MTARVLLALVLAGVASGAAPPASLTPGRLERLKERDRLWELLQKQQKEGQLIAPLRTCRRVLAVQREVFGSLRGEVRETLVVLARLCERKGDWEGSHRGTKGGGGHPGAAVGP